MNKLNEEKMNKFIDAKSKDGSYYVELRPSDFKKPISILLGPNGTGKSMSLKNIEYLLNKKDVNVVTYSTSHDDIVSNNFNFDPVKLLSAWRSEGERMIDSFIDWAGSRFISALQKDDKPIWILIDEADSGLSIDRLMQSLLQITHVVKCELEKGRDIHVVFTCNSYEMYEVLASDLSECIWVPTKQRFKFNSYEEFKELYLYFYDRYYTD